MAHLINNIPTAFISQDISWHPFQGESTNNPIIEIVFKPLLDTLDNKLLQAKSVHFNCIKFKPSVWHAQSILANEHP